MPFGDAPTREISPFSLFTEWKAYLTVVGKEFDGNNIQLSSISYGWWSYGPYVQSILNNIEN